jgi:hypothetical protein
MAECHTLGISPGAGVERAAMPGFRTLLALTDSPPGSSALKRDCSTWNILDGHEESAQVVTRRNGARRNGGSGLLCAYEEDAAEGIGHRNGLMPVPSLNLLQIGQVVRANPQSDFFGS